MKIKLFFLLFVLPLLHLRCQIDSNLCITFDFNDGEIKERNNRVTLSYKTVSLTKDRFGNDQSAVFLQGHNHSYLSLGTSELLKPKCGAISLWAKLDQRIYIGKGYDGNPIIRTKNAPGEDFTVAYTIGFDGFTNRLIGCTFLDSTKSSLILANDTFKFGSWKHLVINFNDDYFKFYIDGVLQSQVPKGYVTKYQPEDSVVMGHSASKKNERFAQGSFDDIQIFHRMLSDKEVLDLFHAPNPNKTKDLLRQIVNYALIVLAFVVIIIIILYRNKRVLKRQKEQLELKTRISQLELQVVKTQMNPHFISNSLAAIQELIYTHQTEKAGHYVAKFSFFLRQVLKYSDKNFITLAEELDVIRLNVDLEQLRFKNQFNFDIQIHENIDPENISIPALITQPLIENAIWHGLLPLDGSRVASLKITVSIKNNIPYLEITDNGIGRKSVPSMQHQSKGTQLIIDKIESLNRLSEGNHYKLFIEDLKDTNENPIGTKITIELNAETDD